MGEKVRERERERKRESEREIIDLVIKIQQVVRADPLPGG